MFYSNNARVVNSTGEVGGMRRESSDVQPMYILPLIKRMPRLSREKQFDVLIDMALVLRFCPTDSFVRIYQYN